MSWLPGMTYTGTPAASISASMPESVSWLSVSPLNVRSPDSISASGCSRAICAAKARTSSSMYSITLPSASVTSSVKNSPLSVSDGAM